MRYEVACGTCGRQWVIETGTAEPCPWCGGAAELRAVLGITDVRPTGPEAKR